MKAELKYPGMSWSEIEGLSEAALTKHLQDNQIEYRPFPVKTDAELAEWYQDDINSTDGKPPTKVQLKTWRQEEKDFELRCKRAALHAGLIAQWIMTLSDSECWHILEAFNGAKAKASEKRYTGQDQLRQWAVDAVYAMERSKVDGNK